MQIDWNHHAYLLINGRPEDLEAYKEGSEYIHVAHQLFGIDESRALITVASLRSVTSWRRLFVIEATRYTPEAQNALLKLFEAPPAETHFFILHPRASDFLPTLLSRVWLIESETRDSGSNLESLGQIFLSLSPAERLERLASFLDDKNVDWKFFIKGVEQALAKTDLTKNPANSILAGRELARARSLLSIRGSATKLILEHLALALPTFAN